MVAGRIALFVTISAISLVAGGVYSPLGAEATPWSAVWSAIRQGFPGMILQVALLPAAVWLTEKWTRKQPKGRPSPVPATP